MPWCDDCSKFWNPASMTPSGACPTCGRTLAVEPVAAATALEHSDDADSDARVPEDPPAFIGGKIDVRELAGEDGETPWHFKLLVVALVLYLAWRVVQLIVWAVG